MHLYDPDKAPCCKSCKVRMIERKGKFGPFFGCRNFPACTETVDLEEFDHSDF